jgi:predicted aminopeptidase
LLQILSTYKRLAEAKVKKFTQSELTLTHANAIRCYAEIGVPIDTLAGLAAVAITAGVISSATVTPASGADI